MDVPGQGRQWDPNKGKAPKRVIVKRSIGQQKNAFYCIRPLDQPDLLSRFLKIWAQILHRGPNFLNAFLGVEVEHQKMTNFHRYLWLYQAKNPN